MNWSDVQKVLIFVQHIISVIGFAIIISGLVYSTAKYCYFVCAGELSKHDSKINIIRLELGRVLILGLEVIVAGDLIGTLTAPDYYTVGILAIVVGIRTLLSYSINSELMNINKEK
jgi:uncharacterized membrane protein